MSSLLTGTYCTYTQGIATAYLKSVAANHVRSCMIDHSTHTDDYLNESSILATVNLSQHTSLPGRQNKSMIHRILTYSGAAGSAQYSVASFLEVIARSAVSSSLVSNSAGPTLVRKSNRLRAVSMKASCQVRHLSGIFSACPECFRCQVGVKESLIWGAG